MAAGLGFKTFVSGDVLTAADTNGYLMQGVWVFANAAARTAAVTSPQEGNASFLKDTNSLEIYDGAAWIAYGSGDLTAVQAGVGITVTNGTGPIPTITNSSTDLITSAGDILYGTAADTVARLGIGTAGQVLTVNSGATAPEWATAAGGGMTLISTTTLSSTSTAITSIPGTYKDLIFKLVDYKANTSNGRLEFRINGSTNTQNYFNYNTAAGSFYEQQNSSVKPFGNNEVYTTGTETHCTFRIYNYASSTAFKNYDGVGGFYSINSRYDASMVGGSYQDTTAITSLTIATNAGTMTGSVLLYGAN